MFFNQKFLNERSYKFVPELSEGSESDPVTVLNMVMVTAANKFRNLPDVVSCRRAALSVTLFETDIFRPSTA